MLSKFKIHQSRSACLALLVKRSTIAATNENKTCNEVPGPNPSVWKFIKDIRQNVGRVHLAYEDLSKEFGPIVQLKFPMTDIHSFLLSNPDTIEHVLRNDSTNPARPVIPIWEHSKRILGASGGIFSENGENWYRMRTVVNQVMLKPNTVQSYAPDLNSTADDFLKRLEGQRDTERVVDNLADNMFRWALESVGTILYERRLGCLEDTIDPDIGKFIEAVKIVLESTAQLLYYPPFISKWYRRTLYKSHIEGWRTLFSVAGKYSKIKLKEVENIERKEGDDVGLIEYFVKSQNMSMKEVHANITELMGAAVDTISNAVQFLLYELAKNPAVQNKLYEEITDNIEKNEMVISQSLRNMSYLKACIKETLRMYPTAVTIGRVVQEDTVMEGFVISKGKWWFYVPYALGRQERLFSEPDVFKPERFLRSEVDRDKIHPFANLPFGFGTRMCVGRRIAELEMQVLVSKMIRRFRLEPVDLEPVQSFSHITMSPAKPLRLRYLDRV